MQYNNTQESINILTPFIESVISGNYAGDDVLYTSVSNRFPVAFINNMPEMSLAEIAFSVLSAIIGDDVPATVVKEWVTQTFSFRIPLVEVSDCTYRLELFHGPTRTHKDIGARFLANLIGSYVPDIPVNVVTVVNSMTAHSVGEALASLKNLTNLMLMPKGCLRKDQVHYVKENYRNAVIAEMDCDRRRCEAIVRDVLSDKAFAGDCFMTTANAFNPAVVLMRVVFFFHAYARMCERRLASGSVVGAGDTPVFIIPDSNPGMAAAARIATDMGLPIRRIITMPESHIDRYGRYLELGETAIAMATFPASLSSDSPRVGSCYKIPATVPALKKFITTVRENAYPAVKI